jgi:pimeloyl-ACP methyl ester carboxylesterase
MREFNFQIEKGDKNIGTVYLPVAFEGKIPVVIYCHGWAGTRLLNPSTKSLCFALIESSAALVTFDFWGCGDTGGNYSDMSYGRWTSNLKDILEWISHQEWADCNKIGCFGISSGTTPALRLAETGSKLAFVVSVATCLGSFIDMPNGPGKVLIDKWDALTNDETANIFEIPFKLDFFKDAVERAPVYDIRSIKCPVFFLQGKSDNVRRRSDAWIGSQLMQKYGLRVKYLEMEGGDHGLDNLPDQCAQEVIEWLKEIQILPISSGASKSG